MKKTMLLLLFAGLCLAANENVPFQVEQAAAYAFLAKHQSGIKAIEKQTGAKAANWLAVVAPELMRYHLLQDFLETKALEQWYVKGGSSAADFSIGPFQMKPSFLEQLEQNYINSPELNTDFPTLFIIENTTPERKRAERINRLKQFDFQLKYAHCFYKLMDHCYNGLTFNTQEDRLRFYAAAYNYGFERPIEDIEKWMLVKAFPYGQKIKIEQVTYAELSTIFYHRFLNENDLSVSVF